MVSSKDVERMEKALEDRGNEDLLKLCSILDVGLDWGVLAIIRDANESVEIRQRIVKMILERSETKWRAEKPDEARDFNIALYCDDIRLVSEGRQKQISWIVGVLSSEGIEGK